MKGEVVFTLSGFVIECISIDAFRLLSMYVGQPSSIESEFVILLTLKLVNVQIDPKKPYPSMLEVEFTLMSAGNATEKMHDESKGTGT